MEADPVFAILSIARLCEVDLKALWAHDWFSYHFESSRILYVEGSAPMVRLLSDGGEENIERVDAIRPKYYEAYDFWGMSIKFAQAAWLRYTKYKKD